MFQNSWSVKLSEPPQFFTIASLPDPSFVYQGSSNTLSVYSNNQTHSLPIRKQVIALNTIENDQVLLLTRYSLNCFDLLNNQQKFSLQFENAQKLYVINDKIYVVSGTSLYCYTSNGQQQYVNHVSANIVAVAGVQNLGIGSQHDIIIATTDMTMFRYQKLNIVFDYGKIVGNATSLCWIGKSVMVGTEQGPIALYQSKKYKWKAKSIHPVFKILKFQQISQYNKNAEFQGGNKVDKIIVCRTDGNIQLRDWQNGATLTKVKAGENIVDIFIGDFRREGINQIICGLESGNMRVFNLTDQKTENKQSKVLTAQETIQKGDQIQKLNKIKQQLLFNISQLKNTIASSKNNQQKQGQQSGQILNEKFKVTLALDYQQGLVLQINSVNGYISGLTFQQPLMPVLVEKIQKLRYPFLDSTQIAGQIQCQIMAHSSLNSTKYEVIKRPFTLPKFWKWGLDPKPRKQISGKLTFKLIQRNSRFILWAKQCFYINISEKQSERLELLDEMRLKFFNWYENKQMELIFSQNNGTVCIKCDCLKTMGQIFQDLINYIGLKHLNSELEFPQQKQKVKELLETVQRLSQNKVSMSTDLADTINNIKFLLVKGQSARQVSSMNTFRRTFGQVMELNRNLVTEIEKKNINMKILTQTLKNVNNFINQIANVRYGQPKNQVIAKCRQAIKTKKFPEIYTIMNKGFEIEQ